MKKLFGGIVGAIVLIIIIGALVLFFGWSQVPDMLASRLSKKLGVQVTIDDISLSMNSIDVQKIMIGNTPGGTLPKSFSADQVLAVAPLFAYLHDDIVIDEIDVDNIYLGLEFDAPGKKTGNWTKIMGNLEASEKASSSKSNKTVLIKKLILTNINITLAYTTGGKAPQQLSPIKRLEFTNVSSTTGLPMDQITEIIMREMLKQVFSKEGLQNMIEGFLQSPQKGVENLLKPFSNILGK